ncbi:MAG: hypothetical protein SFV23_02275 [Planctomycetaceae bacterium]|nr:hypothetical protein [Planctomycetaceae bacterium]
MSQETETRVRSGRPRTRVDQIRRVVPIVGHWTIASAKAEVTFDGWVHSPKELPDEEAQPYGIALAPGRFLDGQLSCRIRVISQGNGHTLHSDSPWSHGITGGLLFGYQNERSRYFAVHVGGFNQSFGILRFEPGRGWQSVIAAGSSQNLEAVEHELALGLNGQEATVSFDGVDVISNFILPEPIEGQGFGLFAWGRGKLEFKNMEVASRPPQLFVVMPFSEPFDTFYRAVVRKVARHEGFEIVRVDEIRGPGNILEDIRRQIAAAHVVVAEISSPNPNVFYEVGYAHALNKPVILLARRSEDRVLPFDLRPYRVIFYDDTIGGKDEVERTLRDHLKAVLR